MPTDTIMWIEIYQKVIDTINWQQINYWVYRGIEDKLTSLEFDNAGNQTSPSDEEFEWNDVDAIVVSNDAKHMNKNEQDDQKCCCQR